MTRLSIPESFWNVRYDSKAIPDALNELTAGANCQRFAYALLAFYGVELPPFRSSDLWEDREFTFSPAGLEALDLLLFNEEERAFGAHIAVFVGDDSAIHLALQAGRPEIWPLERFRQKSRYRCFIGAKRVREKIK